MSDLNKIVEDLSKLTVIEAVDLSKLLEEKWGVSAVAAAAPSASGDAEIAEEKDSFTIFLKEVGSNKIAVIKEVRSITGLGLKESKGLVDKAPGPIKEDVPTQDAEKIKAALEAAGAKVELQ